MFGIKFALYDGSPIHIIMGGKRVLVTGAAGFIVSHLCTKLLDNRNTVIGLDNYATGNDCNIKHLINRNGFYMAKHDITIPYFAEIDQIYNLASSSSLSYQLNDPVRVIKTSIIGSINMLGLARRTRATILHASTGKIYGNPAISSISESYPGSLDTMSNSAPYAESKRMVETIFASYNREYNVDTRIAPRIFNTYGPGMPLDENKLIPSLIIKALRNQDITIYGNGEQARCFCHIDDTIEALCRLMDSPVGQFTSPMNIGNDISTTVKELTETILLITGSHSKINYISLPGNKVMYRQPDISYARQALKWRPKISLEKGLTDTIAYFEGMLHKDSCNTSFISWVEMAL